MILASNNAHKLEEFRAIFADMGIEIIPQSAAGCHCEVDETGETFEENASLKAIAGTRATGQPAVADDSGLCVDALDGEPGVYSARWAGGHDDADNNRKLMEKMRDVPGDRRGAHFVSVIACAFPDGRTFTARGECPGVILDAPRGKGGFGYDPFFLYEPMGKTFAEMDAAEKNAVSHRARAMARFAEMFAHAAGEPETEKGEKI